MNVHNDSASSFTYSLWSNCGVETITENCSSSTIKLEPARIDPTCTEDTFGERTLSIFCRKEYVEDLRERLSDTEECQGFKSIYSGDVCNVNSFGTYCALLDDELSNNFTAASSSCRNTSTCYPLCTETLNNITNTVGCCFNDRYNDTNNPRPDWLSYEFWSRCSLKPPEPCKEFLNDAATIIKASSFALASALTIAVMILQIAI